MKTEFHILPVSPPLNQWIQFVWISKGENDTTKSKILPNGVIELILNFGNKQKTLDKDTLLTDKYFKNYWVAGLQNHPIIIQSLTDTNLIGIRFLPGGAYPFFKFPVNKISDVVVEADWMKKELKALRNSISDLSDHTGIRHTIEKYLWTKFDGSCLTNESVMYVANKIFFAEEDISISELVRKAGYSHKHFLSLFKSQVGTSPKNLQRIMRLQKVIRIAKEKPNFKWTDILYQFPFYDAAHFAHDFKELTGMTPDLYLSLRTFDENHCLIR
ncbi:MAG: helix-turn-helix transcriptional regulator [Saprospiraceae bacterium]|uniref:Helix-turn-helix transcriptional regulator n=1 Tax=Candidatus Opimibacter skivensis TaxID=2982028 RepID=A0A9D7SSC8_9BACT|nr:helix-turn-helix transcriptional regulator [Candidatus Opimibacter skivensis]